MKFNRVLIVGLAVLMILVSGCLVFADEAGVPEGNSTEDDTIIDNDTEDNGTEVDDVGVVNGTLPPEPDNATITATSSIYSEPTQSNNTTTKNATTVSDKHATGNPLLVLLIALAGIGTVSLKRRK